MLWLAIRFPCLPLEAVVEQRLLESDSLGGKPSKDSASPEQIICEHNQVLQASVSALQRGIKTGMKTSSARALSDSLHIFDRDQRAEQEILKTIAQRLLFLSPTVCIMEPDILLLEIEGCLKLFHGLDNLFDALRQSLNREPHQWFYGFGHTPLCASLLTTHSSESHYYQHLRSEKTDFIQQIGQIPIERLPLGNAEKSSLQAPGFRTLADILALPKAALGKRQGVNLLDWLQRLLGDKPDIRAAIKVPPRFYAEIEFSDPIEQAEGLIFSAKRLLSELHYFLQQHQKRTKAIRWHFTDSKKNVSTIIIRRSGSNADLSIWQDLTRRHFDQLILPAETLKIALDCARIQNNTQHSEAMFEDSSQRAAPETLIDKLTALTQLQLTVIEEADSHLPDDAQSEVHPLTTPKKSHKHYSTGHKNHSRQKQLSQSNQSDALFCDAPLWLLDQPKPLRQHDQTLYLRGKALELLPGEQIINDGWWQKEQTRHYHVARLSDGMVCWVFFSPQAKQWYLHGFF